MEYCWGECEELVIQGLLAIDAAGSERRRGDLELPARLGQSVACAALSVVTPAAKPHLPPALLELSPRPVQHHVATQGTSTQAVELRFFSHEGHICATTLMHIGRLQSCPLHCLV